MQRRASSRAGGEGRGPATSSSRGSRPAPSRHRLPRGTGLPLPPSCSGLFANLKLPLASRERFVSPLRSGERWGNLRPGARRSPVVPGQWGGGRAGYGNGVPHVRSSGPVPSRRGRGTGSGGAGTEGQAGAGRCCGRPRKAVTAGGWGCVGGFCPVERELRRVCVWHQSFGGEKDRRVRVKLRGARMLPLFKLEWSKML